MNFNLPPITKNIIIINVIMFIATELLPSYHLRTVLGLHYFHGDTFAPYQLITSMFMHGDLAHLFFNMFAVFMFGAAIEQRLGAKRYLILYFITGLGASILHYLVFSFELGALYELSDSIQMNYDQGLVDQMYRQYFTRFDFTYEEYNRLVSQFGIYELRDLYINSANVIGASGAVFGLLAGYGMLFPNSVLQLLFPPIPIKAKYFVIGYGALELYQGFANNPGDNVAHFAHVGGALFGFLLIKAWKRKSFL